MNRSGTLQVRLKWVSLRVPVLHHAASVGVAVLACVLSSSVATTYVSSTWWISAAMLVACWWVALGVHITGHVVAERLVGRAARCYAVWVFGEIPDIFTRHASLGRETVMTLCGPLSNVVVGAVAAAVSLSTGLPWALRLGIASLAGASLVVGVINVLPGLPFDGGRVLTGVLSYVHDEAPGSWVAALVAGRFMALYLLAMGILLIQIQPPLTILGIWLGWLGWSLRGALRWEHVQRTLRDVCKEHSVGDLVGVPLRVDAARAVGEIVSELSERDRAPVALVSEGDTVHGVVLPARAVAAYRRDPDLPARDVAVGLEQFPRIDATAPACEAFALLLDDGVPAVVVIDAGRVVGVLSLGSVERFLGTVMGARSARATRGTP